MAGDATEPFATASQWMRRSLVDGDEVIIASPHAVEDGHAQNLDVWVRYRGRNYVTTAYSVAEVARLVERDSVHYDVSWFVIETITEDNLVRAIAEIIADGGFDSVFEPTSDV